MGYPVARFFRQLVERQIGRDAILLRGGHHLSLALDAVPGLPRLDNAPGDRLGEIRHREPVVDRDDSAEALALRAGADWVVETEQRRRRVAVLGVARGAVEMPAKSLLSKHFCVNGEVTLAELVRLSGRLEKPRAAALGQADAILHDGQRRELALGQALGRLLDPQQFRQSAALVFCGGIDDAPVALFADELQRLG